jgi:hypothetical protein
MNDPTNPNWFTYLLGGFVALLTAVFEFYRRRVDNIDAHYLSKEDFQLYMKQMREDRVQMHNENLDRLKDINSGMERVHDRIDLLFTGNGK